MATETIGIKIEGDSSGAETSIKVTIGSIESLGQTGQQTSGIISVLGNELKNLVVSKEPSKDINSLSNSAKTAENSVGSLASSVKAAEINVSGLNAASITSATNNAAFGNSAKNASDGVDKLGGTAKTSDGLLSGFNKQVFSFNQLVSMAQTVESYVKSLAELADSYSLLKTRLGTLLGDQEKANEAMAGLEGIADRTHSSLDSLGQMYYRVTAATQNMGVSQSETLKFVEALGNGIRLSGANTKEAEGALLQLSQAMAAGRLHGQEFNSVASQLGVVMQAIAGHIGVSSGELKELARQGALTSTIVLNSVNDMAESWKTQAAGLPVKFDQALQDVSNKFSQFLAKDSVARTALDGATGALELFANNIDTVGVAVEAVLGAGLVAAGAAATGFATSLALANPVMTAIGVGLAAVIGGLAAYEVEQQKASDATKAHNDLMSTQSDFYKLNNDQLKEFSNNKKEEIKAIQDRIDKSKALLDSMSSEDQAGKAGKDARRDLLESTKELTHSKSLLQSAQDELIKSTSGLTDASKAHQGELDKESAALSKRIGILEKNKETSKEVASTLEKEGEQVLEVAKAIGTLTERYEAEAKSVEKKLEGSKLILASLKTEAETKARLSEIDKEQAEIALSRPDIDAKVAAGIKKTTEVKEIAAKVAEENYKQQLLETQALERDVASRAGAAVAIANESTGISNLGKLYEETRNEYDATQASVRAGIGTNEHLNESTNNLIAVSSAYSTELERQKDRLGSVYDAKAKSISSSQEELRGYAEVSESLGQVYAALGREQSGRDEQRKQRALAISDAQLEVEKINLLVQEKQKELDITIAQAQLDGRGIDKNEQARIDLISSEIEEKKKAAEAAQNHVTALENEKDAFNLLARAAAYTSEEYKTLVSSISSIQTPEELKDVIERIKVLGAEGKISGKELEDGMEKAGKKMAELNDVSKNTEKELASLGSFFSANLTIASEAASRFGEKVKDYFDQLRGATDQSKAWNQEVGIASGNVGALQAELDKVNIELGTNLKLINSTDTVGGVMNKMAAETMVASETAQKAYLEQRIEYEKLLDKLGSGKVTTYDLNAANYALSNSFTLLDDSDLSSLKGQIDSVRDSIKQATDQVSSFADNVHTKFLEAKGETESLAKFNEEKYHEETLAKLKDLSEIGSAEDKRVLEYAKREEEIRHQIELTKISHKASIDESGKAINTALDATKSTTTLSTAALKEMADAYKTMSSLPTQMVSAIQNFYDLLVKCNGELVKMKGHI